MTILVTGAAGFIGRHVLRCLTDEGRQVRALDIANQGTDGAEVEWMQGSVLDPDDVARSMRGASGVIHLAANANLWARGRFDHDRLNTMGTCRVLAAARREGVKTVHVSSFVTLMSRGQGDGVVLDEGTEIPPTDMIGSYARSKRQSELVAIAAQAAGQAVTVVMPSAPVGPGDIRLTPPSRMIEDLANGRTPALLNCSLNLVDVRAVAQATVAALENGADGERYLLSGDDVSMRDVSSMIAEHLAIKAPAFTVPVGLALAAARLEAIWSRMSGIPPKAPLAGVQMAAQVRRFDNSKARAALGFSPRPWRECVSEALTWMSETGRIGN